MDYPAARQRLLRWLRAQLRGPLADDEILTDIQPLKRYPCGTLFPVIRGIEGLDPASAEEESLSEVDGADQVEATGQRPRYIPPSSVGFSFFARGETVRFQVRCAAARYLQGGERDERGRFLGREFHREALGGDAHTQSFDDTQGSTRLDLWADAHGEALAGLDVLWRRHGEGWLITVSLFNRQEWDPAQENLEVVRGQTERSLFQVELACYPEAGEIGVYPRVDHSLLDGEEQELELQYRHRYIYAVGHGAAVDWVVEDGRVREIRSEFLPAVEVPQVTADTGSDGDRVLSLDYLADPERVDWRAALDGFVAGYADWVTNQQGEVTVLDEPWAVAGGRICQRMQVAVARMRQGVARLAADAQALQAFRLANRAMLAQMRQQDRLAGREREASAYRWRPFQLAFLLTTLVSTIDEDDQHRDRVDLIWFPTGGGKTEAYLGLIALLLVWRRLRYPGAGGGTAVLMRYTLRLLTAQQFQRAARMILALELIRRDNPGELGEEPFSVGLWVGGGASPNRCKDAQQIVHRAVQGGALEGLVLGACPWCETPFQAPGNFLLGPDDFGFRCHQQDCAFGDGERLPCNVVDQALYARPPSLLLATVDKFARLAWDDQAGKFFGRKGQRPPELIVQDELHLIASALGSVAGLYEAALDVVLQRRQLPPKIIASTATIRGAGQQVQRLYGRDLSVFPPPGLSCDDAYFARSVPLTERPGRLYVGYLAPRLGRRDCLVPLAAALLVAPEAVFGASELDREALLEAWWTQVVYHGSLKGVSNSHNAFVTGVREAVERFMGELGANREAAIQRPMIDATRLAQLTSQSSAGDNARVFARLACPRGDEECLDAVLATNMVSVGLDVARLALMVINGQPLTTAEYIQASSRVGRAAVPGLVFANYYRDQARSLSHYENFRAYHESFYRFVEATSITPYTYQARLRALHAALVIAVRHGGGSLRDNARAGDFDAEDAMVRDTLRRLKIRCGQADPPRREAVAAHLEQLARQWHDEAQRCHEQRRQLCYQVPDRDNARDRLLYNHADRIPGLWPTLQSMRNVENTSLLKSL